MTLKVKSAIISFGSIIFIVVVMGFIINKNIITDFQLVENQRVEQNIRRLEFILKDKLDQLDTKISDWSTWDDTYVFVKSLDQKYIDSNFSQEAFQKLGIDEVLFIDNNGGLVWSFFVEGKYNMGSFPGELYSHFATGSAILSTGVVQIQHKGFIALKNDIVLFSMQRILKSDGTGPARGWLVFAKQFDSQELDSLKDLTQFNTTFIEWSETSHIKSEHIKGNKNIIEKLNDSTIAGYYVLEDVYNKPIGILRADINRDITLQGKTGMATLILVLLCSGLIASILNYGLMNSAVIKKILSISSEMKDIGNHQIPKKRLTVENSKDEIAQLRLDVNTMLDDIESSQIKLASEVVKRESLVELINSIVVMLDENSHISMINQYGCDILGYSKEELIGKDWIDMFIIPEEKDMIRRKFSELMQSSTSNNTYIENSILTKEGVRLVYGWHNTVIKDSQGITTATLSLGNDISEVKEKERIKEEYMATLKRMNDAMIGRELKMIELKKRITELEKTA